MKSLDIDLPQRLTAALASGNLPGRAVQRPYAHPLGYGRHYGPAPDFARQAAVLVWMYWSGSEWVLPLTKRVARGIHASQICFAGGGLSHGETPEAAALRECEEEMGSAPTKADVLGQLSPIYVYASNNLVRCVVATTHERPTWRPDPSEVAEIIDVPLRHLCQDPELHSTELRRRGLPTTAPCFRWKTYDIWGATSMMIAELKAVILQ